MNPELSTLVDHWLRYITPEASCQVTTGTVVLDEISRHGIAHIILQELSAMDASKVPDASRSAKVFVEQTDACSLQPSDMKCEANALCLALLNADLPGGSNQDMIPVRHTLHFINSFSERVNAHYLSSKKLENKSKDCLADSPPQPESLQHALRSPLQGAMLFLDLLHEDAMHGAVAIADVDSAIDSLKHIARLLDSYRDG